MKRNKKEGKSKPRKTIQFRSRNSIYEDKENESISQEDFSNSSKFIPKVRPSEFLSKRHKTSLKPDEIQSKIESNYSSSQDSYADLKDFEKESSENNKADQLFILPDHVKANPEAGVQRILKVPKIVYKEKEPKPKPLDGEIKPDEIFKFQQENFYPKVKETKIKKEAVKKNKELKHIKRDIDKEGFGKFDPVQYGNFEDKARFKRDNKTGLSTVTKHLALDDYNIHNRKMYAWKGFEGPKRSRSCTDLICIFIFGICFDFLISRNFAGRSNLWVYLS